MAKRIYGYVRVSAKDQNESRQIEALAQFPVERKNIFMDKRSGKDFERPSWNQLLKKLQPGDLLVVKSIDRLGRNYDEILVQWRHLTKERGVDICVLDMPALDTRLGSDREVISSVVVQLMNFCDERVRKQTALQAKGIQAAKQRGVKFGRPPKKYSDEFISAARRFNSGEITMKEALVLTGMKQSSFYYHIHKMEEEHYFVK